MNNKTFKHCKTQNDAHDNAWNCALVNKLFWLEIQVHKISWYSIVNPLFLHKHLDWNDQ